MQVQNGAGGRPVGGRLKFSGFQSTRRLPSTCAFSPSRWKAIEDSRVWLVTLVGNLPGGSPLQTAQQNLGHVGHLPPLTCKSHGNALDGAWPEAGHGNCIVQILGIRCG